LGSKIQKGKLKIISFKTSNQNACVYNNILKSEQNEVFKKHNFNKKQAEL
jgi:hypothetical protein